MLYDEYFVLIFTFVPVMYFEANVLENSKESIKEMNA